MRSIAPPVIRRYSMDKGNGKEKIQKQGNKGTKVNNY
jgi:hypothetical protein